MVAPGTTAHGPGLLLQAFAAVADPDFVAPGKQFTELPSAIVAFMPPLETVAPARRRLRGKQSA
jgi:hypothetical protein